MSFKSAAHVSPEMAAAAVNSHEREHVRNNAREAEQNGMRAFSTVKVTMSICPECGKAYISGGTTTTTVTSKKELPGSGEAKGNFVDIRV